MEQQKTYSIKIDGVDKAYKDTVKLSEIFLDLNNVGKQSVKTQEEQIQSATKLSQTLWNLILNAKSLEEQGYSIQQSILNQNDTLVSYNFSIEKIETSLLGVNKAIALQNQIMKLNRSAFAEQLNLNEEALKIFDASSVKMQEHDSEFVRSVNDMGDAVISYGAIALKARESQLGHIQGAYRSFLDGTLHTSQELADLHDNELKKINEVTIAEKRALGEITELQEEELRIYLKYEYQKAEALKNAQEKEEKIIDRRSLKWYDFILMQGAIAAPIALKKIYNSDKEDEEVEIVSDHTKKVLERIEQEKNLELIKFHNKNRKQQEEFTESLLIDTLKGREKELAEQAKAYRIKQEEAKKAGVSMATVTEWNRTKEAEINKKYDDINEEERQKEYQKRLAAYLAYQKKRMQIQQDMDAKMAETDAVEESNRIKGISKDKEKANTEKDVTTAYDAEIAFVKEKSAAQIEAETKKYDDLIALAKKYNLETIHLAQDKEDRIKALEKGTLDTTTEIENQKQLRIKAIKDNAIADEKAEAEKLLNYKKSLIDTEKMYLQDFYDLGSRLTKKARVEGSGGLIDVEASRKKYEQAKTYLSQYLADMEQIKNKQLAIFDEEMAGMDKNSAEYESKYQQRSKAAKDFETLSIEVNESITKNTEESSKLQGQYWQELHAKMQKYNDIAMSGVNSIFSSIKTLFESELEEINEKSKLISEQYDEVSKKHQQSNDNIQQLEEEAATANGSRAEALRKQINEEKANKASLATQEKQLAKEKEKMEKEKQKKERQMKRMEMTFNIIQAISNTALGVTKALTLGPILGPIMAVIIGAAGAVQIATMTKQLSKMEDGGLLRGRRHRQGGMRVEGSNIEVEGGEYVVNRRSTSENLGLISYINSQRRHLDADDIDNYFAQPTAAAQMPFGNKFENGGELPATMRSIDYDNRQLIQAISSIRFEPKVAVADIIRAQETATHVDGWSDI